MWAILFHSITPPLVWCAVFLNKTGGRNFCRAAEFLPFSLPAWLAESWSLLPATVSTHLLLVQVSKILDAQGVPVSVLMVSKVGLEVGY
jgi:hypothetical protein